MWTYRCYDDGETPNLWDRWYLANADFNGQHDAIFDMLEQLVSWREPHAKFFITEERIIEIRLTGPVKHRVLGYYGDGARWEFVVLGVCNHKGAVYDPPDIRKTVVKRKKEIERGLKNALACERPSVARLNLSNQPVRGGGPLLLP